MMMAKTIRSRRDRLADWLVIIVVAIALLSGWAAKAWAERGRERFTSSETGLTLRYPVGWLMSSAEEYVFKVRDPRSGPFKTTYQITAEKLDPARPMSLMDAVQTTSVSRARKLTAFRMLDIVPVDEEGQPLPSSIEAQEEKPKPPSAIWSRYVYVDEEPDPFRESLPVVVLGLDYTAAKGGNLYTLTLLAAEADFAAVEKDFKAFIRDAAFGRQEGKED
jgi:hypothetical protein